MAAMLQHHAWREFYINNDDDTPLTLVPVSAGVQAILAIAYSVSKSGGGTSAGTTTCLPGGATNLYNAGGETFTLSVAANGEVTVARSAGTSLFDARIHLVWV